MLTPSGSAPASVPVGKEREAFGTQLSDPLLWTQPPDVQGQRPRCPGTQLTSCSIGLAERTGPEIVPHGQGLLPGWTGAPPSSLDGPGGPPLLPGWTWGCSSPPWMDWGVLPSSLDGPGGPPLLPGWTGGCSPPPWMDWGSAPPPWMDWGSSRPPWMDWGSSPPPCMDLGGPRMSPIFLLVFVSRGRDQAVILQTEGP